MKSKTLLSPTMGLPLTSGKSSSLRSRYASTLLPMVVDAVTHPSGEATGLAGLFTST